MENTIRRHMENGEPLEVIYMDGQNKITQRKITVFRCEGQYVTVYCHTRKKKRIFRLDHILSAQPVRKRQVQPY